MEKKTFLEKLADEDFSEHFRANVFIGLVIIYGLLSALVMIYFSNHNIDV